MAPQVGGVSRFRTVLFDLDGTILDHFAAIHRTHVQTCQHFGLPPPSMEQVRRAIGGGLELAVSKVFGPGNEALVERAVPVYRSYFKQNNFYQVRLMPGARELLQALNDQGVQCAVFTNKHGPTAREVLAHVGVDDLLDGTFGATDTPWLKPDLEFAQHALKTLNATTNTTCLIGDSPYDVEAGKVAGFPVFCVTTGTHTAEELTAAQADGVYPDLTTLGREALGV